MSESNMPLKLSDFLLQTVDREIAHLRSFAEDHASKKPAGADSWSPKQELGHLIDSAANNHIRFVKSSLDGEFRGAPYAQNQWVDIHGYQEMKWADLVEFWYRYNTLLARVVSNIPMERLQTQCFIGESAQVTLDYLIEDYVLHMQHHIDHLLGREEITSYPSAAKTAAKT